MRPRFANSIRASKHGAKPGDRPVEQPTKFDLVLNLERRLAWKFPRPCSPAQTR